MKLTLRFKGGPGSGHHGHAGVPGHQGGSAPGLDYAAMQRTSTEQEAHLSRIDTNTKLRDARVSASAPTPAVSQLPGINANNGKDLMKHIKDALSTAGLGRTSNYAGGEITGLTISDGSTGFSVKDTGNGLNFHIVVSGKKHMPYRQFEDSRSGETNILHEPINPERLYPKIKAVFEKLGIPVKSVRFTGAQQMWDDDVDYNIEADYGNIGKPKPIQRYHRTLW